MSKTGHSAAFSSSAFRINLSVFISHSNKDAHEALAYREFLSNQGFHNVWTYEERLDFGGEIKPQIKNQIKQCDFFIVLISNDSINSPWVQKNSV